MNSIDWNDYDDDQKKQLRLALRDNLDISYFIGKNITAIKMEQIRLGLLDGIDLNEYRLNGFRSDDLKVLRECYKRKIKGKTDETVGDVLVKYIYEGHQPDILREIADLLSHGFPMKEINLKDFNAKQLNQIKTAFVESLDYKKLIDKNIDSDKMEEIRLALGYDIDLLSLCKLTDDCHIFRLTREVEELKQRLSESKSESE